MSARGRAAPSAFAGLLCRLTAVLLPRASRGRYLAEWRADLAAEPEEALGYAWSVLIHVVELRRVVVNAGAGAVPLRCRLHLHAYVLVHDNPEDRKYVSRHCRRCGFIKDDGQAGGQPQTGLAWGASMGIH
ncbi:MAG TPA: hypothetical protein VFJ94_04690 [Intrasporangium sp.]|uniref:hypothetical protein n=1 Tax=Intrasporangium sp. TaxID=1925024 RepID=UPI002D78EF56|nr:hypothetical protein [Intrasporangium sp.]HET7397798.1 hypothetical protein [Intrasporangium sp.]